MIQIEADEQVALKVRKHWLYLLREFISLIGLILLPGVIALLYNILGISSFVVFDGHTPFLWIAFIGLWLLFCSMLLFAIWTDYYLDVLIITNKRVLDIEQNGLFSRDSSEFRLDRVQDISVDVSGILATFLNFGDIHIQTAGEGRQFIATYIPNPYDVKKTIAMLHDRAMEESRMTTADTTVTEQPPRSSEIKPENIVSEDEDDI